jgi:dTDP-4-dehydrorhamnose reductase
MSDVPRLVLLTGATGHLGSYVRRELIRLGWPAIGWTKSPILTDVGLRLERVDLTQRKLVVEACRALSPSHIIHAAALANALTCAREPEQAFKINAQSTQLLAELAKAAKARLLLVSTDLVFNGEQGNYQERDPVSPLSVYGRSKVGAEEAALSVPRAVVVRLSLLFGPDLDGRPYFFDEQLRALRERRPLTLFHDEWRTPLHLAIASRALLDVLVSDWEGILHVGGAERLSRLDMGLRLARHLGHADPIIDACSRMTLPGEPRPRDTSLDSSRWRKLLPGKPWPLFEEALELEGAGIGQTPESAPGQAGP